MSCCPPATSHTDRAINARFVVAVVVGVIVVVNVVGGVGGVGVFVAFSLPCCYCFGCRYCRVSLLLCWRDDALILFMLSLSSFFVGTKRCIVYIVAYVAVAVFLLVAYHSWRKYHREDSDLNIKVSSHFHR